MTKQLRNTGLRDSSGKQIKEGDTFSSEVDDENFDWVCVWIKEFARFAWLTQEEWLNYSTRENPYDVIDLSIGMDERECNKIKITGNIYFKK